MFCFLFYFFVFVLLFCFVLFYFVLFCFVLFCFVLFCVILFYFKRCIIIERLYPFIIALSGLFIPYSQFRALLLAYDIDLLSFYPSEHAHDQSRDDNLMAIVLDVLSVINQGDNSNSIGYSFFSPHLRKQK